MAHRRLSLILTISMLGTTAVPLGQAASEARRPTFAGAWTPSDPARSDVLFNNGLGWIPGTGRLVIEQRPNRLTVTKHVPDDKLDPLLAIHGRWDLTVAYPIIESRGRSGGFGAGGDGSSWRGDRLVLTQSRAGSRLSTVSLSLDGDRLKLETHVVIAGESKESTVPEWFSRTR